MAINEENYDKYKELMKIYEGNYTSEIVKQYYPQEVKKANFKIILSVTLPILTMLGSIILFANILPVKAFFPISGALLVGLNIVGTVSIIKSIDYKNNLPIEIFRKENPQLKLYSKEALTKKISKYETEKLIKNKNFEEEKLIHQTSEKIGLDLVLASKEISTEEKIAILEKEKAFWETVLLDEQKKKIKIAQNSEKEEAYEKVITDVNNNRRFYKNYK